VGVAERVARERGESIGQAVGYQIRLESKKSGDTRMLFCTTGILLRRMGEDTELEGVSHVIVDEVHARSTPATGVCGLKLLVCAALSY
jgi:HrpA-like RNA helicase